MGSWSSRAEAGPRTACARVGSDGYDRIGFQASVDLFPVDGCSEITEVGPTTSTFVTFDEAGTEPRSSR